MKKKSLIYFIIFLSITTFKLHLLYSLSEIPNQNENNISKDISQSSTLIIDQKPQFVSQNFLNDLQKRDYVNNKDELFENKENEECALLDNNEHEKSLSSTQDIENTSVSFELLNNSIQNEPVKPSKSKELKKQINSNPIIDQECISTLTDHLDELMNIFSEPPKDKTEKKNDNPSQQSQKIIKKKLNQTSNKFVNSKKTFLKNSSYTSLDAIKLQNNVSKNEIENFNQIKDFSNINDNKNTESQKISNQKKINKIYIHKSKYTNAELLKKRLKIKTYDFLDEKKFQKHLNFYNLNPFRNVKAIIDPIDDKNCSIDLICQDRFFIRPYIGADNSGLKDLNTNRIYAGFDWNRAFAIDSILSYQYLTSYNINIFQSHTGYYTIYLPWQNILNIFASYAYINVDHQIPYIEKHDGYGLQTSIRYDVCLPLLNSLTHDLILGFDFKRTNTDLLFSRFTALNDTEVNLSQFLISYSLNWNKKFYKTKFLIELYISTPFLKDEENFRYNDLRRFAMSNYLYAKGYFTNIFTTPNNFLIILAMTGQISNQNLLPSETFGLGGYNSVRGYYEREVNTDSGFILNCEVRTPSMSFLPKKTDSLKFLVFLDYGFGSIHKTYPFEEKNYQLLGYGPGFRYVANPNFSIRLDWGIKGINNQDFYPQKGLLHFSLNLNY